MSANDPNFSVFWSRGTSRTNPPTSSEHLLKSRLQAQGYDLAKVTIRVSSELGIDPGQVWAAGKHRITVKAGSLMCYWAVRGLGISTTELSKKLGVSQPSVSISVKRGEKIAKAMQFELIKG